MPVQPVERGRDGLRAGEERTAQSAQNQAEIHREKTDGQGR